MFYFTHNHDGLTDHKRS